MYDTRKNVELLIAADELLLNDLTLYIEERLIDDEFSLKRNFVLIQKVVNELTQFTKLLQIYEKSVQQEPSLILRADDFETIQQDIFLNFLAEHGQSLIPIEVWDKLVKWAIAQPHELPSDVKKWTSDEMTTFR